jgi:hypothetical protein
VGEKLKILISKMSLLLIMGICLSGCASFYQNKDPYPPAGEVKMAESWRHEFVNMYLQGRFCEAKVQFEKSVRAYLMRDDFCSAAENYMIFHNLKMYSDVRDKYLFETALKMRRLGGGCPKLEALFSCAQDDCRGEINPRDAYYRKLLSGKEFDKFLKVVSGEEDKLYASVYFRKAVRIAVLNSREWAKRFLEEAIKIDSGRGWVVFLCEDWSIMADLEAGIEERERMLERVRILSAVLQPCD